MEFEERLVKAATQQDYIETNGGGQLTTYHYFKHLHWMMNVISYRTKVTRALRKAMVESYDVGDLKSMQLPKGQFIRSGDVIKRYKLMRLLNRLLQDYPAYYLKSYNQKDSMTYIWFDKWRETSFWKNNTMSGEVSRLNLENSQIYAADYDWDAGCTNFYRTQRHRMGLVADQLRSDGLSEQETSYFMNTHYFAGSPVVNLMKRRASK